VADGQRAFDLVCCAVAAPFAVPLGAAAAVAVRLSSPGPVLHRATRVGMHGVPFTILKFRTMRVSPPGPKVTTAGDARVTTVGRWLRRTKLDELPQLVNVLRGEMSIVGPRPEDPAYVAHFPVEYATVLTVRPGMTGPAVLRFRDEERLLQAAAGGADLDEVYVSRFLPAKLELDLDYVARRSLGLDFSIVWATVRALVGWPPHRCRGDQ